MSVKVLRKRTRELQNADALTKLIGALPKAFHRLAKALRRTGQHEPAARIVDAVDGHARQTKKAAKKAERRKAWQQTAVAQSQANAEELQTNPEVLSRLEEMISNRIGKRVRHVRSETIIKSRTNAARAHGHRRAYTKHWFELSGPPDERLARLVGQDRLLVAFVKSAAAMLRPCPPLEFILSEQGGQGFRTPYFFGSFRIGNLEVAAWEALEIGRTSFGKYSRQDQKRIVEAIAALNTTRADGTVPVRTRWIDVPPSWYASQYEAMASSEPDLWKALYTRTRDVLRYQDRLVSRLDASDQRCLTHNDIGWGTSNVFVPPIGDVVIFDWEISTLSIPGADLGVLCKSRSGDELLSCYIAKMSQLGFELNIDTVRYARDLVAGFRSLQVGWRSKDARRIEDGLRLLTRLCH